MPPSSTLLAEQYDVEESPSLMPRVVWTSGVVVRPMPVRVQVGAGGGLAGFGLVPGNMLRHQPVPGTGSGVIRAADLLMAPHHSGCRVCDLARDSSAVFLARDSSPAFLAAGLVELEPGPAIDFADYVAPLVPFATVEATTSFTTLPDSTWDL